MALTLSSYEPKNDRVKVDVVCVPAIGADPRITWARQTDGASFGRDRLDYILHEKLEPDAQVYLYDHLTQEERLLEVKPPRGPNDRVHQASAEAFAEAESRLSEFGVVEWADRFLDTVQERRRARMTDHRPMLFLCHSTGGVVVKQALSRKPAESQNDLAAVCLGVTFFATPHHGSSVLSEPEYVQTVRNHLGLKWEMSENLRHDFRLRNTELETLNYKFAVRIVGAKIYSYVESSDTYLSVLSTNDSGGETLTTVRLCIVDSRSGTLSTSEVPVEDEEVIQLNTTHVGAPRFLDEDTLFSFYLGEITSFVKGFSAEESAAYHALHNDIMTKTEVDVHQFYEVASQDGPGSMKILSAHPCLRTFLEVGPSRCMDERLRGMDIEQTPPQSNGSIRPAIEVRPASEPIAPTLTVTAIDTDEASSDASRTTSIPPLGVPAGALAKSIPMRRPSVTKDLEDPGSPGHLKPKSTKTVKFRGDSPNKDRAQMKDVDQVRRPQRKHLFPLPSQSSVRFKWIHVPFTHAGWVPHVLTTISQDKGDLSLHSKVLMDKMWFSQHNRSRHASPHAQFVRPSSKCLMPKSAERGHTDGITTPQSATDDIQFVVYLPYLHWDSFENLQKRAEVIKRRRQQAHARPVAKDVALGRSLEHKMIWQHLTCDRPVHCRRTLDQYGYPSLKNTAVRDGDQILYKRTKADPDAPGPKEEKLKHKLRSLGRKSVAAGATTDPNIPTSTVDEDAKVLMVDQMWLWVIDNQTVITFFAAKEKEDNDNGLSREGDLRSEIYQDVNGDYANQCVDPYDFAALAVFHAIKALLDRTSDRNLQVFRIFEEYISILTEQQTSSFKHFRNNQRFEKLKDDSAQSHIDNRNDLDALLELRDIEDELKTIDKLIKEQQSCVLDMIGKYQLLNAHHTKGKNGINFLLDVQQFLGDHKEQIDAMLKGAVAAQGAFKDLLDMKQKQANILEAHLAREQTEVAADQSRSVMIFTIFTIIFLPLSFFASVFGINSREWTGGKYPHLTTIFMFMVCISLAVIIIALLVAFNKFSRRMSQRFWKLVAMPFLATLQRFGIIRRHAPAAPDMGLDLEKQAAKDRERVEAKRLSTISRTYSKMNWEEQLRMHRQSVVGF